MVADEVVGGQDERTVHLAWNANFYFRPERRLSPFLSGGFGTVLRLEDGGDRDDFGTLGAGATYRLSSWLDVRAEARDYLSSFDRFGHRAGIDPTFVNEIYVTLGLDAYP